MADAILFPGTEMEVIEKYPPGKRLDHPDFADVAKTTYARGVITEVKKLTEDPITVESMVKVEIEGVGESEYLPLFYHPKKLYWDDDEGGLATDFNEEGGYFEKSWMSFRGSDEVAVMLKEGVPVAVLGFADGVPRVGEDVLKLDIGNGYLSRATSGYEYAYGNTGPDGLALGLLRECAPIEAGTDVLFEGERMGIWHSVTSDAVGRVEFAHHTAIPGLRWAYDEQQVWLKSSMISRFIIPTGRDYIDYYYYIIPIGPILYWIEVSRNGSETNYSGGRMVIGSVADWDTDRFMDACVSVIYAPPPAGPFLYPNCEPWAIARAASFTHHWEGVYTIPEDSDTRSVSLGAVYAAPYSDELYQEAVDAGSYDNRPADFILQGTLPIFVWPVELTPALGALEEVDFSMFVRPHTKEELLSAGMWPATT